MTAAAAFQEGCRRRRAVIFQALFSRPTTRRPSFSYNKSGKVKTALPDSRKQDTKLRESS